MDLLKGFALNYLNRWLGHRADYNLKIPKIKKTRAAFGINYYLPSFPE